jgi:cobalt/nickel transport system ATP-binding protein
MPDPLISIRQLTYAYPGGAVALNGIDFELYPGECVVLLGANGSGKTTFLLHLNGLLLPTSGSVQVKGLELTRENLRWIRQKVGLVFQDADEQLFMPSVLEDVSFAPLNQGIPPEEARAKAARLIELVGLGDLSQRPPYHLSSGEKRRAAIAGVLAMDPEVLVLDEPTTYLDPPGQRTLVRILENLPQAKVIATHDLELARRVATRAVFFERGRIAGEGSVPDLVERFAWGLG